MEAEVEVDGALLEVIGMYGTVSVITKLAEIYPYFAYDGKFWKQKTRYETKGRFVEDVFEDVGWSVYAIAAMNTSYGELRDLHPFGYSPLSYPGPYRIVAGNTYDAYYGTEAMGQIITQDSHGTLRYFTYSEDENEYELGASLESFPRIWRVVFRQQPLSAELEARRTYNEACGDLYADAEVLIITEHLELWLWCINNQDGPVRIDLPTKGQVIDAAMTGDAVLCVLDRSGAVWKLDTNRERSKFHKLLKFNTRSIRLITSDDFSGVGVLLPDLQTVRTDGAIVGKLTPWLSSMNLGDLRSILGHDNGGSFDSPYYIDTNRTARSILNLSNRPLIKGVQSITPQGIALVDV